MDGCWDFSKFKKADGETDWDAVIDVEIARRKLLEDTPITTRINEPVNFDTAMVPWWVWMRRFHLPEAEKANGRAGEFEPPPRHPVLLGDRRDPPPFLPSPQP